MQVSLVMKPAEDSESMSEAELKKAKKKGVVRHQSTDSASIKMALAFAPPQTQTANSNSNSNVGSSSSLVGNSNNNSKNNKQGTQHIRHAS